MSIESWLIRTTTFIFGLVLGSFATALIYRIPRGLPWAFASRDRGEPLPRSACPSCGYVLQPHDLVPVFSWLMLGGRCRKCRSPIGYLYPLVEFGTAFACLAAVLAFDVTPDGIALMLAMPLLAALIVIDFRHRLLPDSLNGMLAGLSLIRLTGQGIYRLEPPTDIGSEIVMALVAMTAYALLSWLVGVMMRVALRKEALGLGDVKFFGVAGLWLGLPMLPAFMILAGVFGIGIGLIYRLIFKQQYFPFGPALILAFTTLVFSTSPHLRALHLYFPFAFLG